LKILIGPQTAVGLNPSIAAIPLLKSFNVIYFQPSDKPPNFLVMARKDFETETLDDEIYDLHSGAKLA
jgi:hypothetical protein